MLTPILSEELSREVLKSYTFNELKSLLKELRKQQKRVNNRDYYFRIYDNIQKVTFKMRNIIRKRNKLRTNIIMAKEF